MEKLPRRTETNMANFPPLVPLLAPPPSLSKKIHPKSFSSFLQEISQKKTLARGGTRARTNQMASTSTVSMAMPITYASQKRLVPSSEAFFKPLPLRPSKAVAATKSNCKFAVRASLKEKAVTGLTAAALTASMMVPDVAEAAVTPSLKNFLLSIVAGGVVLAIIVGAVIGVSNFDPVKRS